MTMSKNEIRHMRVYLDNSFLNRPFDDQASGLNKFETAVLFLVTELIEVVKLTLVGSSVIEYENSLNPVPERKAFVERVLVLAMEHLNVDDAVRERAASLEREMKISGIDALHVAVAESGKVDLFITCDYTLVKKYKGHIRVIRPAGFLHFYEQQ